MLVSQGCQTKEPQAGRVGTTFIYSLIVLEARSLKARRWQGHACLEGSRGECDLSMLFSQFLELLVIRGISWLFCVSLQSLPLWSYGILPVCVCLFSTYQDNSHIRVGPLQHLNLITSAKTVLPNKVSFISTGDSDWNVSFWGTQFNSLHNVSTFQVKLYPMFQDTVITPQKSLFKNNKNTFQRDSKSVTYLRNFCLQSLLQITSLLLMSVLADVCFSEYQNKGFPTLVCH